jgi:hypothetical protein
MRQRSLLFAFAFALLLTVESSCVLVYGAPTAPTLVPVSEHHVAGLNSNMPYIAGFQVNADDLTECENVNATAVTVSFASAEPAYFPVDSWLGCGMFVQAQDHVLRNVDYGFYMMLVLDASGRLFIDLGLHQTEEDTPPIQAARSSLVYSYTWLVNNVDASTPIKLVQTWLDNGSVQYSISVSGFDEVLADVNVVAMPNCGSIIPRFYDGNVVVDQFPFSRYVNYFQFGIVSNKVIDDTHWQADIENPMMWTPTTGWTLANKAWLLEGDHSFLDHDLMWGGAVYPGISVTSYVQQSQSLYELDFKYTGNVSAYNMTLWNVPSSVNAETAYGTGNQDVTGVSLHLLPIIVVLLGGTMLIPFLLIRRKAMRSIFDHGVLEYRNEKT